MRSLHPLSDSNEFRARHGRASGRGDAAAAWERTGMQRGPWQGSGQLLGRSRRPIVAALAASALVLSACGGGGGNKGGGDDSLPITKPNVVTNDPVRDGGSVTMALEKDVPNFNSLSGDGVSLESTMVGNGIFPATFVQLPDFTVALNKDLLDSAEQTSSSPQTIVYK